jgi:glutamine synthetase
MHGTGALRAGERNSDTPICTRGSAMIFVDRYALWNEGQEKAAAEVERLIETSKLDVVRLSFADQHGILRGKTIVAGEAASVMRSGCGVASSLLLKDSAHRTVFPVFKPGDDPVLRGMSGAADVLMVADPSTFRILPWAPGTGWLLCDLYFPDGRPVPHSTRQILRNALTRLGAAGFDYVAGLEVEFHLFKASPRELSAGDAGQPGKAPEVTLLNKGFQYLTELRYDELDPILDILRRNLVALGLPLRTLEVEYGPSQCEFTFRPEIGLDPADTMILFRSAVKQISRRNGYHATFMCRPRIENVVSSGWHLHQSLRDRKTGKNAFVSDGPEILSPVAQAYLAGLLKHARAATAFSTPTINGYKRYAPYSLAPDRAVWGADNRGVMVRVVGKPGDPATRLENRSGEPAANPYLYMASQILAGLDGIAHRLQPGPSADTPYESIAPPLPKSLSEALAALREDACFRDGFGDFFIDYYTHIKEAELARFHAEVSEWEQREYFEIF